MAFMRTPLLKVPVPDAFRRQLGQEVAAGGHADWFCLPLRRNGMGDMLRGQAVFFRQGVGNSGRTGRIRHECRDALHGEAAAAEGVGNDAGEAADGGMFLGGDDARDVLGEGPAASSDRLRGWRR